MTCDEINHPETPAMHRIIEAMRAEGLQGVIIVSTECKACDGLHDWAMGSTLLNHGDTTELLRFFTDVADKPDSARLVVGGRHAVRQ